MTTTHYRFADLEALSSEGSILSLTEPRFVPLNWLVADRTSPMLRTNGRIRVQLAKVRVTRFLREDVLVPLGTSGGSVGDPER